jgi:hypothetical protein
MLAPQSTTSSVNVPQQAKGSWPHGCQLPGSITDQAMPGASVIQSTSVSSVISTRMGLTSITTGAPASTDSSVPKQELSISSESSENIVTLHSLSPTKAEEAEMAFLGISNSTIFKTDETEKGDEHATESKVINGDLCHPTLGSGFAQTGLKSQSTGCLIELSSLAADASADGKSSHRNVAPNIKATILPASSTMVKSATGSISISHAGTHSKTVPDSSPDIRKSISEKLSHVSSASPEVTLSTDNTVSASVVSAHPGHLGTESGLSDQAAFRRPTVAIKPKDDASPGGDTLPPKPFRDLPKGNRRLGRRPNYKRVVVPRVLPLLPKQDDMIIRASIPGTTTTILTVTSSGPSATMSKPAMQSGVLIPVGSLAVVNNDPTSATLSRLSGASTATTMSHETHESSSSSCIKMNNQGSEGPVIGNNLKEFHEGYLNAVPGSISCNSNDFEDLLKVRREEESNSSAAGDIDGLSLSSFMEISLPESTRSAMNDLRMEDLENSNCSLTLSSTSAL